MSLQGRTLLHVDDLRLEGRGLVLILGGTGSGKSTFLRSATRHSTALDGLEMSGRVVADDDARAAYVPQDASDALLAGDLRSEALVRARAHGVRRREANAWLMQWADAHDLAAFLDRPFHRMSAGERQRIALRSVQIHQPDLLLLDEPFTHLDEAWRARLRSDLAALRTQRLVLVATHEPEPLLPMADRVVVLREGRVAFDAAPEAFGAERDGFPELIGPVEAAFPPSDAEAPRVVAQRFHSERGGAPISATWGPGVHALEGPNGCGKTSLLRCLQGLGRGRGNATVADGAPDGRRSALLVEEPAHSFFNATVRDEIAFGLRNEPSGCDVRARVREALADFDLEHLAQRHPYTLSGGERTRLALACVDALRRPVILLDEPTQGLDGTGRRLLRGFLHRASRDHVVVVATHDPHVAAWGTTRTRLEMAREVSPRIPS